MTVGIVTGAARGMGAACAARMAAWSTRLVVADRDEVGLAAAAAQLSGRDPGFVVEPVVLDVADRERSHAWSSGPGPWARCARWRTLPASRPPWPPGATSWPSTSSARRSSSTPCTPLATEGTAIVCFASISASLALPDTDLPADAALDEPLHADFLDAHPRGRRPRGRGPGHGLHVGEAGRAPPGAA